MNPLRALRASALLCIAFGVVVDGVLPFVLPSGGAAETIALIVAAIDIVVGVVVLIWTRAE